MLVQKWNKYEILSEFKENSTRKVRKVFKHKEISTKT